MSSSQYRSFKSWRFGLNVLMNLILINIRMYNHFLKDINIRSADTRDYRHSLCALFFTVTQPCSPTQSPVMASTSKHWTIMDVCGRHEFLWRHHCAKHMKKWTCTKSMRLIVGFILNKILFIRILKIKKKMSQIGSKIPEI